MNKKVIIFGCSEFSAMLQLYIEQLNNGDEVIAYCEDLKKGYDRRYYNGFNVVSFEEVVEVYPPNEFEMLIAVGYNNMNDVRKEKYQAAKVMGYKIYSYFHPSVVGLQQEMNVLGEGNIFLENVALGCGVKVGNCNIMQMNTVIAHHTAVGDYNFFAPCCAVAGDVKIANNCFFGIHCTVKNGITLSEYTLGGAGSTIICSTEPYNVVVPARSVILDKSSKEVNLLSYEEK